MPDVVEYVLKVIELYHENYLLEDSSKKSWAKVPTYCYGHCLGAILAFEVAKALTMQVIDRDHPNEDFLIKHLVVSSSRAPHVQSVGNKDRYAKKWAMQTDTDLMNRTAQLGGVPAILRNKHRRDMLRMFIPSFRNDYAMYEKYDYIPLERKSVDDRGSIDCPLTVFGCRDDKHCPDLEEVAAWELVTDYGNKAEQNSHAYFFLVGGHSWMNIAYKEKVLVDYLLSMCVGTETEYLEPHMPSWEDEDGDEDYVREVESFYGEA